MNESKSVHEMLFRLKYLTMMSPGTGKTEAICDLAKVMGARVLVHNVREALRIEQNMAPVASRLIRIFAGINSPILVDTHSVSVIASRLQTYIKHIEQLLVEQTFVIRKLEEQRNDLIRQSCDDDKAFNDAVARAQYELVQSIGTNVEGRNA